MDTKVLYASAIVIAAISGGCYYYSGKGEKLSVDAASNKTYVAKGVQLTQTDEQGNLHIKAQVDRLEQDMQKQTSQLDHLKAFSYKNGNIDATFYAKKAQGFNDNEKVKPIYIKQYKVNITNEEILLKIFGHQLK
mgnify:CR=1 FL=1